MAYGQSDTIDELKAALDLLVRVATQEATVTDVRKWLEENYPHRTKIETKIVKNKW